MMETAYQLVTDVGFPIVAFFLMYHLSSTTIKENTCAIRELGLIIRTNGKKK